MSKQASKAMAAAASTAGTIAAVAAKPRALGFDCFAYPGDSAMKLWKLNSDYKFIGFYLRAPAHSNNTFLGTRQKLADMGWGTAIIYVGRQAEGPGSGGPLNGPLGTSDATDAIAKTAAEGFGRLSVIFLDVEHMDTIPQGMKDYINAWFLEVVKSRFVPGMYCAASNAAVLKVAALKSYPTGTKPPQFWVAGGRGFDPLTSDPTSSSIPFANMWQGRLQTTETHGGVTIPIDINVADSADPSGIYVAPVPVATASAVAAAPESFPLPTGRTPMAVINTVIQKHLHDLLLPGVLQVRAGYQLAGGIPTSRPAIVVTVAEKADVPKSKELPRKLEGFPIDVRQAGIEELLRLQHPELASRISGSDEFEVPEFEFAFGPLANQPVAEALAISRPKVAYQPPPAMPLNAFDEPMTINCHASPDAGWPTLKPFLAATTKSLTVGMYDFGATHIETAFKSAVHNKQLTMVLDGNPKGPQAAEDALAASLETDLGKKLKFAWAAEGSSNKITKVIFPNAYHIKVAVRDSKAMWLSSGNWQNTNQPDIDPLHNEADRKDAFSHHNREWHVVIEHAGLSKLYEAYLQNDYKQAAPLQVKAAAEAAAAPEPEVFVEIIAEAEAAAPKPVIQFFEPLLLNNKKVKVQPVLTPDNYIKSILPVLNSAKKSLYMQTQYMHAASNSPAAFLSLVKAIQTKILAGVDVKLIVHKREKDSGWLEKLRDIPFDTSVIRLQDGVHNKGIVVDSKIVVVGSHNWSSNGTIDNRDASLIFFHAGIAKYFEKIFLHDWTRLASPDGGATPRMRIAIPGEATPQGFRRMKLKDVLD